MMKVCGGVDPSLLGTCDSTYKVLVANLLFGLIDEAVGLEWRLEKKSYEDKWYATDVKLSLV